MKLRLRGIFRDQAGQGLTEYAILMVLVAIGSIVAVRGVGTALRGKLNEARTRIDRMKVESGTES